MKAGKWVLFGLAGLLLGGGLWAVLSGMARQPEAASLGIIGGADGPTAIFVTGRLYLPPWLGLGLLCLAAGLVLHFVGKHKQK